MHLEIAVVRHREITSCMSLGWFGEVGIKVSRSRSTPCGSGLFSSGVTAAVPGADVDAGVQTAHVRRLRPTRFRGVRFHTSGL